MRSILTRLPLLFLLALTAPALASDGVLEINQTCAVQTGCFPGDTAGYPVTLASSGSYRLTSNLVVPDENTDGLFVSADEIHIDLNGFRISGPVVCTGAPATCFPDTGTGSGVARQSAAVGGTRVENGSVVGMGDDGIRVGRMARVSRVEARSNRGDGIFTSGQSIVSAVISSENGGFGINAGGENIVTSSSVYGNGAVGIACSSTGTISGNSASANGSDGINAGGSSTVSGNTSAVNGIDGIQCGTGCLVRDNTVRANGGFGLRLGSESAYGANVVSNNTGGTVSGGSNILLNFCDGASSPACP